MSRDFYEIREIRIINRRERERGTSFEFANRFFVSILRNTVKTYHKDAVIERILEGTR